MKILRERAPGAACGLIAVLSLACAPGVTGDRPSQVDSVVQAAVDGGVVAGAVVSIRRDGKEVVSAAYGMASIEPPLAATTSTFFNIGSVTKVFTATALLELQESERLDLDERLGKWLPHPADDHAMMDLTIRQLINHSSGLNEYAPADLDRWERTGEPLDSAFVLSYLRARPLDFEPGTHWAYNSSGFYLAGLVIQVASGREWFDYLDEAVLGPLGLKDIRLCDDVVDLRARGYELVDGELVNAPLYIEAGLRGDGGLCVTAASLTAFLDALDRGSLLSDASLAGMRAPTRLSSGVAVDYGLGTRLGSLDGRHLWGHTGGHAGTIAVAARYPDEDVTIAVLTNTIRSASDALVLEGAIAAALFDIPTEVPATVDSIDLEPFTGRYVGEPSEPPHTIRPEGNRLIATYENGREWSLLPIGGTTFVREHDPYPLDRYVFHMASGKVLGYSGYYNGFHGAFYRRLAAEPE